jgi:hypothetical protein
MPRSSARPDRMVVVQSCTGLGSEVRSGR